MKKGLLICTSFLIATSLSACGSGNAEKPAASPTEASATQTQAPTPKLTTDPVTLKLQIGGSYTQVFQTFVEPIVKEKYPNVTLQYVDGKLADEIAAGDVPDIYGPNVDLNPYLQLGLQMDMRDLIKEFNFDVNSIDPTLIKSVQAYSKKGEIYALPSDRNVHQLLYNKDIFDKFAVTYPTDGMQWDEIFDLAKKLSRTDGGTQYYGLNFGWQEMKSELGLHYFDNNGKANVTTPDWQKLASTYQAGYPYRNTKGGLRDQFTKDKNTAMVVTNSSFLLRNPVDGLNWDYAIMPTFENKLINPILGQMLAVTNTSKNKELAFAVLQIYFSTDVQKQIGLTASLVPAGTDPSVAQSYGSKKKDPVKQNLMADFNAKPAIYVAELNSNIADSVMGKAMGDIVAGNKDINTALRDAQEEIDKQVAANGVTSK